MSDNMKNALDKDIIGDVYIDLNKELKNNQK